MKKTAPPPPSWRALYDQLKTMTFAQLNLSGADTLTAAYPPAAALIKRSEAVRAAYSREDNNLHIMLMDMVEGALASALASAPLPAPVRVATIAFEEHVTHLFDVHGILGTTEMWKKRYSLQRQRSEKPRWLWCTIFAHLKFVSEMDEETLRRPGFVWEATSVCARYAGPAFTEFAFMVLCVFTVTGMDPFALVDVLEKYLGGLYSPPFNGALPADFYFRPQ